MLLPLLGACALVGPFHGSEWEPVRGLISQDRSCRDLRCCGNLLILCLFLIWQIRHTWWRVTRTRPSMRKVIKVPLQKWAVPSVRHATFFRVAPESFISPRKLRGLDAHVQQWVQKQRWGYQRSLQKSWARHLQSWLRRDQGLSWDVHTPSEPICCTASFSSASLLSQDSSWEALQVPWSFRDGQTHRICKPLLPAPETCQRIEQLLVHSQEESVPLEPAVSIRSHSTSITLTTSNPNLPSTHRLQSWPREFLPAPSNQQLEIPTWKSQACLQEAWAQGREDQELSRGEDSSNTQAPGLENQRAIREGDSEETQASGRQLPIDIGMEDDAETEVLGWGNQRLIVSETEGEIMPPGQENQDQMEGDNRKKIQELRKEFLEGTGGRETEIQAHRREKQEQLRCGMDAETQTQEWRSQEKNGGEDAVETQERKNKKEARGEDEGKTQAQGLEEQGQSGEENGAEIQANKKINKDQVGGEVAVQTQTPGRENLGEVNEEAGVETQALGWGKEAWFRNENVTEIQTPGWKNQGQDGGEKTEDAQALRGVDQRQLRHEIQVGWGNQDLGISEDTGETQISRRKNLREIREEDWVVIQTPWWGNQRLVASEIDREFKISYWGNQNKMRGEHGAEIQAPEKRYQSEDGVGDGINTLAPEAENQGQFREETVGETHPPERRNQEQVEDGNGADIQAPGKRTLRGFRSEDGKETQAHGEENQGQLRSEINGKNHMPKWKKQEFIRGKHGTNTQAFEVENWGMLTSKINGGTHSVEWQVEDQIGGENGAENKILEKRSQKEIGGENGTEIRAAGEGNQIQLQSDIDREIHLSECKNEEQKRGESGTETQAQEKRKQREGRGEDGVQTQRSERENQGQFESEIYGEGHSPERRNWKQTRSENSAGNQASEKRSQREVGSEGGTKIQRLGRGKPRLLRSKVNGKSYSLEWKNRREPTGGEDGAEIQIQGKKNQRGAGVADDIETQVFGGAYQEQLRSETGGEIRTQERGNQNKVGDEDAAAVEDIGSQRKCRAEDFEGPQIPKGENKNRVTGKDVAKANLQIDCSGGSTGRNLSLARTPALSGCGDGATEQKEAVAVNNAASAPCLETRSLSHQSEDFLQASGEREHLIGQNRTPARKHKVGVGSTSQQAQSESWRDPQKDKVMHPGKASSLIWQPWNPQSLAASLSQPSACPSLLCGPASQPVTALVAAPIALTILPKWPFLKKSKQLLLESLMRRKIAHLKWGLPQRILQSYLLFNFLEPLSLVGVRLPGLFTGHELHQQQGRHCEAKGSKPGIKPPEKPRRVRPSGRNNSKLPTQTRALEKCGPHGTEPPDSSTHPVKPRRSRLPGYAREPQGIQEGRPRALLPSPRNPRPAAESKAGKPSSENSRSRKMVKPGVSQMAKVAPSRARTSGSREGHDHRRKECTSCKASKPPRHKFQQPTHRRRGNLGPLEARGAGRWPSSCSTDTSSFKGSFHSAAARLSMILLNKTSWSPQVVKPQHSATNLSLQDLGPTLLPRVEDPQAREGSTGFCRSSLERNLELPGHYGAGAALPRMESPRNLRALGNPKETPQSPPVPKKFGFMKRLKCFFQLGFRK